MQIVLWTLTLFALALWTLSAWGLHTLLTLDPTWLEDVDVLIARMPYASTIDLWFPGWQELLRLSIGLAQALLVWVGAAAPLIVPIVWTVGTVILLVLAGAFSLLVRLLRRRSEQPPTPPTGRLRQRF